MTCPAARRTGGDGPAAQRDMAEEIRKWARGEDGAPRALDIRRQAAGPINYRILTGPSTGTASAVIPTDFYDQLIAYLIEVSGIMQCGPTVLNTGGGETLQIPRATVHTRPPPRLRRAPCRRQTPPSPRSPWPPPSSASCSRWRASSSMTPASTCSGISPCQAGRAIGNSFGTALSTAARRVRRPGAVRVGGRHRLAVLGDLRRGRGAAAPIYANLVDLEYSVIAPYRQSRSCYWSLAA